MNAGSQGVRVDVRGLCKSFKGTPVLHDIELRIEPVELS